LYIKVTQLVNPADLFGANGAHRDLYFMVHGVPCTLVDYDGALTHRNGGIDSVIDYGIAQ
jgi:hypothetical protein